MRLSVKSDATKQVSRSNTPTAFGKLEMPLPSYSMAGTCSLP